MASNQSYEYAEGELRRKDGLYYASVFLLVVSLILMFFAWVRIPALSLLSGVSNLIAGVDVDTEFSIPVLVIKMVQTLQLADATVITLSTTAIIILLVFSIAMLALWFVPLIVGLVALKRVLCGNAKPGCMLAAFKCLAASSISTIVCSYVINVVCMLAASSASYGISDFIDVTYLETTAWAWVVAIVSIVGIAMLRKDPGKSYVAAAFAAGKDKLDEKGIVKLKSDVELAEEDLEELYLAYGKAVSAGWNADAKLGEVAVAEHDALVRQQAAIAELIAEKTAANTLVEQPKDEVCAQDEASHEDDEPVDEAAAVPDVEEQVEQAEQPAGTEEVAQPVESIETEVADKPEEAEQSEQSGQPEQHEQPEAEASDSTESNKQD